MKKNVGIVGMGIVGRLVAYELLKKGHEVSVFDQAEWDQSDGCSFAAAGMIAPYCELETAEYLIARIGVESFKLWPKLINELGDNVYFQANGSVVIAYENYGEELDFLADRIARHPLSSYVQKLDYQSIESLEPELSDRFSKALYYDKEAALDCRGVLKALEKKIVALGGKINLGNKVDGVCSREIKIKEEKYSFDLVVDCRGLGAQEVLPELRGVRGELVIVHAPDVKLNRPVRLLHPKYPVYIVPRGGDEYYIGATAIEAEDRSGISVRTILELLSSAYYVHSGFAEARVVETVTNLRPAFDDNLPKVLYEPGLIRLNGFYRHGYLLSPRLIQGLLGFIASGEVDQEFPEIYHSIKG